MLFRKKIDRYCTYCQFAGKIDDETMVCQFCGIAMKDSAASVIERAGLTSDDIKLIIPHQANLRIINAVAQRLSIPEDKVFINIEKYGNTSAAAVAIAFDVARRTGRFGKGDNVVLVTFGAGLTWGAAAIRW